MPRSRRGLRTLLLVALGTAAALGVWDRIVKPQVIPKRFGVVAESRIYRSGKLTPATMRQVVRDHDIRTIIDLGAWVHDPAGERLEARTADLLGVERYVYDLLGDSTGDPNHYVEALRLMTDPANQPVLVHCGAGTERTGVLVYLYRTIVENVPEEQAFAEARRAGHNPRRNPHVAETIERWKDHIARAFHEGHDLPPSGPTAGPPPPAAAGDER